MFLSLQRQVEAGVPLQICLSRFGRWLRALQLQKALVFPGENLLPPCLTSLRSGSEEEEEEGGGGWGQAPCFTLRKNLFHFEPFFLLPASHSTDLIAEGHPPQIIRTAITSSTVTVL